MQLFTRQGCRGRASVRSPALCRPPSPGRSCWEEGAAVLSSPCSLHLRLFRLFGRDFGLFPGEGPKTPKLANLASPQLRK